MVNPIMHERTTKSNGFARNLYRIYKVNFFFFMYILYVLNSLDFFVCVYFFVVCISLVKINFGSATKERFGHSEKSDPKLLYTVKIHISSVAI